jgi:hypothetical protein
VEGDWFSQKVAPLLQRRCLSCHDSHKKRGGLDLGRRAGLLAGGVTGPAVIAGKASQSLLIQKVSPPNPRMPKDGPKLDATEVAVLARWVDAGAPWPNGETLVADRQGVQATAWWSLRPLHRPPLPRVRQRSWVRNPVDAQVLAELEARGLGPSAEADRATLIRRLTFDLHGLPPTPEEVDAFVRDCNPHAYEDLVERLLASPRYGERWGRHWLDVVHYGDTHGYDKDKRRDFAWPYRDYVIAAFNADKPYWRFIEEQIAGDVLFPGDPQAVIATGFIAAGPWDFVGHVELREGTVDKAKTRLLDRDDMVSTTIATFNSLTVHCARCHDHKFDPIPQKDYYRLQAVFAGVDRGNRALLTEGRRRGLQTALVGAITPPALGVELPQSLARLAVLERQVAGLAGDKVYAILPRAPRPIRLLHRGKVEDPREAGTPGALACVPGPEADFRLADAQDEGSRRAALARWLADRRNPLTWRSVVNRLWQYHFGRGLVDTASDFGRNGSLPTHPALLDWLAVELRDGGGSLKALHRLLVCSSTYRQASAHRPGCAAVDADNRYLWRMNRQRLDAEELRDAVLAVSGRLNPAMAGPGFELFRFKDDHSPVYDHTALEKIHDPATYRRTVYRFTVRSVPNPFLDCLDCADPNLNTPVRNTTLTALQALALLNDPFMVRQAQYFADRLRRLSAHGEGQIEAAYLIALGRRPRPEESASLAEYGRKHGLANACRLLFNMNEFVFID